MTDTAAPPAHTSTQPFWPAPFLQTIKDRDRARDAAVALEQELAHVDALARALAADLADMHQSAAIDLDRWPHAAALVAWATTDHDTAPEAEPRP